MSSPRKPSPATLLAENLRTARAEIDVSADRLAAAARVPAARLGELEAGGGESASAEELEYLAMALGREDGSELLAVALAPLSIARIDKVRARIDRVAPPAPEPVIRGKTGPKFERLPAIQRRNLALNLRARRKAFGWSSAELGSRVGAWQATISRWEDGEDERAIKQENIDKLAAAFGCSAADLLDREPPPISQLPRAPIAGVQITDGKVFFSLPEGVAPDALPRLEADVRALFERYTGGQVAAAKDAYKAPAKKKRQQ